MAKGSRPSNSVNISLRYGNLSSNEFHELQRLIPDVMRSSKMVKNGALSILDEYSSSVSIPYSKIDSVMRSLDVRNNDTARNARNRILDSQIESAIPVQTFGNRYPERGYKVKGGRVTLTTDYSTDGRDIFHKGSSAKPYVLDVAVRKGKSYQTETHTFKTASEMQGYLKRRHKMDTT